jgi:NTE family protein
VTVAGGEGGSGRVMTGCQLLHRRQLLLWALAPLGGCALDPDVDHTGPTAPQEVPLEHAVRVAWVFSSGGPRGFVHVGVVKALAELGLRPDLVVGASAGSLVGTLCASGLPASEIETLALDLSPLRLARLAPTATERFSGSALRDLVSETIGGRHLEELPVPMVCVAQRLRDGAVVGFNRGDAGLAVQASSAIEGQLSPVRISGERFADADLRMPLPVRVARRLGASRVLAVDASAHEDRAPAGAMRWAVSDRHKREITRPDALAADLLLHPDFGYWVNLSREFRERAIDAGYRDTMARAAALRQLHA